MKMIVLLLFKISNDVKMNKIFRVKVFKFKKKLKTNIIIIRMKKTMKNKHNKKKDLQIKKLLLNNSV